jgi:hypothetical protein
MANPEGLLEICAPAPTRPPRLGRLSTGLNQSMIGVVPLDVEDRTTAC